MVLMAGTTFQLYKSYQEFGGEDFCESDVFYTNFQYIFLWDADFARWGTLREAGERCRRTVPTSFVNSWKVWPVITAFSFTFIAPRSRSAFAGSFAVIWQTYLSWLNRAAEEASENEKGRKVKVADRSFEREAEGVVKMEVEKVEKAVGTEVKKVEKVVDTEVKKVEKVLRKKE